MSLLPNTYEFFWSNEVPRSCKHEFFFGYIDMTQNFKDKGKLSRIIKNHTHMKKVEHTSEFPFGIYWWTVKNLKNQNFEKKNEKKKKKKKKKNAGDITLYMCTKNRNHMRYSSWDMNETHIFFVILGHFLLFYPTIDPEN